jgi:phospho-N-acetylmuramoyl-pentapeptide-transferase
MQRFVLVGMVATLIGISLALTLNDARRAESLPRPAGVEVEVVERGK